MQDTPVQEDRDHRRTRADDQPQPDNKQGAASILRTHPYAIAAGLILVLAAAVAAGLWWMKARHYEWTDDAFIDARQFSISPKVAGYIAEVAVSDNQEVEAGQLIVRIDDRDYRAGLRQAEAQLRQAEASVESADAQIAAQGAQADAAEEQLRQAKAALTFASEENARAQTLLKGGIATLQRAQQQKSQLDQAQASVNGAQASFNAAVKQVASLKAQKASAAANVAAAEAQKAQAELMVGYTRLTAQQKGRIVHLSAAKGEYVQAGQGLSMFVPYPIWITANFRETQISDLSPGEQVDIQIDAFPNRELHGHVDSIQSGSGTAFSLLPAENATGNYVKVVQRVPVKIIIDDIPTDIPLGPGMSVVPSVKVR